jgi:hypothetical protein
VAYVADSRQAVNRLCDGRGFLSVAACSPRTSDPQQEDSDSSPQVERLPATMTDVQACEAKKVFIACIHRPGFDSCVPNALISNQNWRAYSDYNLQRNWPLLKVVGCFECKKEARAAIDISFYAMKTEGVVDPQASLFKMRSENYPFVEDQDEDEYLSDDDDTSDDERLPLEKAFELVDLQKGAPMLWSIFPFDMHLTQWALSEVFMVSEQHNASCGCAGSDEDITICGAYKGASEARATVDSLKEARADWLLQDFDEDTEEDVPSPKKFPSTLLIPEKEITENWHSDGTGCVSFHIRSNGCACAIDRLSLRVQKVPNVRASKPIKLLAAVKSFLGTLVWLHLCNPQGVALFSFVRLPPSVLHPFAGARVYSMSLTHAERLRVMGCGFKAELVRLLSLGKGRHFETERNWAASRKIMQSIARHVAAVLAVCVKSKSQSQKRARRNHDECCDASNDENM